METYVYGNTRVFNISMFPYTYVSIYVLQWFCGNDLDPVDPALTEVPTATGSKYRSEP